MKNFQDRKIDKYGLSLLDISVCRGETVDRIKGITHSYKNLLPRSLSAGRGWISGEGNSATLTYIFNAFYYVSILTTLTSIFTSSPASVRSYHLLLLQLAGIALRLDTLPTELKISTQTDIIIHTYNESCPLSIDPSTGTCTTWNDTDIYG